MSSKTPLSKNFFSMILIFTIVLISYIIVFHRHFQNKFDNLELASNELLEIFDRDIKIPIFDDMVPQGLAITEENILISAYDSNSVKNSIISVLDTKGTIINTCDLNMISHVGGIFYDSNNKLLWINGKKGHINAYSIDEILNNSNAKAIYDFDVRTDYNDPSLKGTSFLTIHKGILYVGNFSLNGNGITKKYKIITNNSSVKLDYLGYFKIPDKVQSLAFYDDGKNTYLIMSISFGRNNKSLIKTFKYDDHISDYNDSEIQHSVRKLPPMAEQIFVKNDHVFVLFESNSNIYKNCPEKSETITILNIEDILTTFSL